MTTEVASTRLPKDVLREIDRAAAARGVSRSVYLADLLIHRTLREATGNGGAQSEASSTALAGELRELRETQRSLAEGLREIQVALRAAGSPAGPEVQWPFLERLTFSTFFSEALIKRVSALLYRNPSELGQVVRAAREEALAEAKVWRERLGGLENPEGVLVSRASGVVRLGLIWTATAIAFFVVLSGPWQRAQALAEILAGWSVSAHWRVPVGSVHNLKPVAQVIGALSRYPEVRLSVRLLACESLVLAAVAWALLYGGLREAVWAQRDGSVRRIGYGPRLAPVYPESTVVRSLRAALLISASVTTLAWAFGPHARWGTADLNSARFALLATLRVPDLQREVLLNLAVTFAAAGVLLALAHAGRLVAGFGALIGGGRIRLGGVPIPRALETNHFLLAGSTGTGKTELALSMARTASERCERAVFIDYGANFLTRIARSGDFILNPFDQRSVCWVPWAEFRSESDYMMMARAIVPDGFGESRLWHGLAQQLVAAAFRACVENGRNSIREFLTLLISSPEELTVFAADTPAVVMTQKGNEKMFANTRNVLMEYLEPWRFLREPAQGERGFSIRALIEGQYDRESKRRRVFRPWLFMTFRDDQRAAMQYLSATWMELVIRAKLSLPESHKRRIWEFIDELAACKRIQSLPDELAFVRKKGGAAVIGVQDVAQIRGIYGPEIAQTMLQNLKTKVMLACADPDTARYFSDVIGEQRILRRKKTTTPPSDFKGANRVSTSWEPQMHRLVTFSEIMCLPVRRAYPRLPDGYVHPIKVALTRLKPAIPAFVDR